MDKREKVIWLVEQENGKLKIEKEKGKILCWIGERKDYMLYKERF